MMMLRSILLFVQIVSISCGSLVLVTKGCKADVMCGVLGETLKIKWRLENEPGENPAFNVFQICPNTSYKNCFATGTTNGFSTVKNTVFGDRIDAKLDGSGNGGIYTFIINKLNKTDEKTKLYVQAGFKDSLAGAVDLETSELAIEVNAYPELIRPLASTLYFNENDTPTVNIVASGIPKPTVAWRFRDKIISGTDNNNSNDEYTYEVIIPQLTKQSCGYELHYLISGWNNSIINFTSTVYVNFTPDQPVVTVTERTENNIVVSWQQVDYGLCFVNYTVVVSNISQVIKSTQATKPPVVIQFSSRSERRNATVVKVTASYQGQQSSGQKKIPPLTTQLPPTTNTVDVSGSSSSSSTAVIAGVVAGVIVVIIVIVVIVMYLKKKNEKKSHSAIGSAQDADNSYNHIPMDNRDGAQENSYTSGPSKPPSRENDPDQMLYAELGAGGGRTGPKPAPEQSNYAVVKVDDMGYPARGPTSDKKPQPTYAAVNRDRSRRHSPPPPDDDNEGVIV